MYKSERREMKRRNNRKMGVSGRSVFLLQHLSARPKKRRALDKGETMGPESQKESREQQ